MKHDLRMLREDKSLTQKELGSIIGVAQAAISQFEKAQSKPCQSVELLLMDFFGLDFNTDKIEYKNSRPRCKRKRKTKEQIKEQANMIDDRVCMQYVVDRLEDIVETYEKKDVTEVIKQIEDFKRECIYKLGLNTRIKRKVKTNES